jgi:hypothetical protein
MTYFPDIEISNPYRTKPDNTQQIPRIEYNGFILSREPQYLLWGIAKLDGTRTPTVLRGRYTNHRIAQEAIDRYLSSKQKPQIIKEEEVDDADDN